MIFTIFWRVENGNPEEILPRRWQEISKSLVIPYLCSASWFNSSSWITCDSHFLPLKNHRFICFLPSSKPWPKLNSSWDEQSECQPRMNGTLALLMIRVYRFSTKWYHYATETNKKIDQPGLTFIWGQTMWRQIFLLPSITRSQRGPFDHNVSGVDVIDKHLKLTVAWRCLPSKNPSRLRGKPLTEPRNLNCWNLTPCRHLIHQKEPWVLGPDAGPEFLFSQVHEPRPKPNCRRKHMETWNKVGH